MKWSLQVEGDNRDMEVSLKAHKEEGDPDFFDGMRTFFESLATKDSPPLLVESKEDEN